MTTDGATRSIRLEPSWLAPLAAEFEQPYMRQLREFLRAGPPPLATDPAS